MEKDNAYKLSWNLDHIKANDDYDVWQIISNLDEQIKHFFWQIEPIENLPICRFEGKVKQRLSWLDYPHDKFSYPIVSKKMLDILKTVGTFKHQALPLVIYDWKSTEKTDDFVFLHLLECIDVLDKEKTEFYTAGGVRRAALKMPVNGYPPLFRAKDGKDGGFLTRYISKEAKEALEKANIKGVHFVPLISS